MKNKILQDMYEMADMASELWDDLELPKDSLTYEDREEIKQVVSEMEKVDLDEIRRLLKENLGEMNKGLLKHAEKVRDDCERILQDLINPLSTSAKDIQIWLKNILTFLRYEIKQEHKKEEVLYRARSKPLYNGTCYAVVWAVLQKRNGMWGDPHACFFVDKSAAQKYAEYKPRIAAEEVFKKLGLDYRTLDPPVQKKLEKPIILEFKNKKIDCRFRDMEAMTGSPEFETDGKVSLKLLTWKTKHQLRKYFQKIFGSSKTQQVLEPIS